MKGGEIMARVNAQEWLDKWGRRLNSAGQDIQAGVKRVTTAPGQLAAQSQPLMLQRLTEAINNGTWARNVSAVSLADWQNDFINKGIPRIAQGVTQAQKSKAQVIGELLTAVDNAASAARALPKGNIEQSIARAAAFMRSMQQNAPKRKKV
jgi:hypothetical protein